MFSCEFYEISENIFFNRTPPVAASPNWGYLYYAIVKALRAILKKTLREWEWDFQDFQNV